MRRLLLLVTALAVTAAVLPASADEAGWVATHPVQTGSQNRLNALPDGTVWAVVDSNRLLRSTDAGRTWSLLNPVPVSGAGLPMSGPGGSYPILAPTRSTAAVVASGHGLSRTADAGATWTALPTPSVTKSRFFEYSSALEHTGGRLRYARTGSEVVGHCPYPMKTTPILSSADGTRWTRSDIAVPSGAVQEIRFVDSRRGAALVVEFEWTETTSDGDSCGYSGVGATTSVQVTSDGGRTWRHVHRCAPNCFALSWSSPKRLMVGQVDGRILTSTDGGRRFYEEAPLPLPVDAPITFVQALDCVGERCWVSVNGGGIFRLDGGGSEWVTEVSGQEAYGLQIGDLAAVDAERAVSGGPHALLTRVRTGIGAAAAAPVPGPATLARPGDAVLHADGTLTQRVSLRR